MHSKSLRWTLAAAACVTLAVGLWPGKDGKPQPGSAYAFGDLPSLMAKTRYLHIQGTRTIAGGTFGSLRAPVDEWFDLTTGARRSLTTNGKGGGMMQSVSRSGGRQPQVVSTPVENHMTTVITVCDGQYEMELDPAKKTATFTRLSPVLRRLGLAGAGSAALQQLVGDPSRLNGFTQVGEEKLDGVSYEVWENESPMTPEKTVWRRTRCWFEAKTGNVAKVQQWTRTPFSNGEYVETMLMDKIDRDAAPPTGTFELTPPAGYVAVNSKETAPIRKLKSGASASTMNARLRTYPAFVMPDGSVILGTSSQETKPAQAHSQDPLFANLTPGGDLPKLPIEVYGLRAGSSPVNYTGRHLAWTKKAGEYIEWGLYVPQQAPPAGILGVNLLTRTNPPNPQDRGGVALTLQAPVRVDAAGFNDLVTAAIAELNDDGAVPDGLTYDSVTRLAQQIRASMNQQ